MAQRKSKESLIVEIPKPRLTDEELMDMFYGGERRSTKRIGKEESPTDSPEKSFGPLLDSIPTVTEKNKPSLVEPFYKEPSFEEPYHKEPIKEEVQNHTALSSNPSSPAVELQTQPRSVTIFAKLSESSSSYESKDSTTPQPPHELQRSRPNRQVVDTGADSKSRSTEIAERKIVKDSPGEGLPGEGFLKLGVDTSPGEFLKKAFDVLPMLSPLEQLLYLWFLNMSREVGRESCRATMSHLQRASGISEKLVRENIRSLLRKGCLEILDGGAAGRAALYRVALPAEAANLIIKFKGSQMEGSPKEPSPGESTKELIPSGNLPKRNLPSHIERESYSYTLSNKKEPSPGEPFSREGSPLVSLPTQIADNVIDRFYSMTGQTRISRQKRERSRSQLFDLVQQGFQVDDVLYAIEWARGNITGPIHSFGLIPEIIGQAISKRPAGTLPGPRPRADRSIDQRNTKSDAEVEQEQKEHERLEAIYATLSTEEQDSLRSEALRLVESEYGSHVPGQQTLVRIKLMEILRKQYAEQGIQAKKGG